jgi:uncharacterized protein (TIGR02453 family)
MKAVVVEKSTLGFLSSLARNNNRDWFMSHRDQYEAALQNVSNVIDALIINMNQHDQIETPSGKKALYRIYNDVRFSKDKTPYSPRFAGYLKRVKPQLRGGYYFWIKPGASRAGCGFAYPNPEDLRRIREDISLNYDDWRKLLKKKPIVNTFGSMQGEQLRTAPKGYERDHPAIDLLRYKQFWFERSFSDQEVLSRQFVKELHKTFRAIRPFFDYMTDVLTTDGNGESRI